MKDVWRVSEDLVVSSLDLHDMVDVLSGAVARLGKALDVIYSSWHVQLVIQVLVMAISLPTLATSIIPSRYRAAWSSRSCMLTFSLKSPFALLHSTTRFACRYIFDIYIYIYIFTVVKQHNILLYDMIDIMFLNMMVSF